MSGCVILLLWKNYTISWRELRSQGFWLWEVGMDKYGIIRTIKSGAENMVYLAFVNPPKTLDPARSYTAEEAQFTAQIYEPPLQYDYLKRPYTLEPLKRYRQCPSSLFIVQKARNWPQIQTLSSGIHTLRHHHSCRNFLSTASSFRRRCKR